MATLANWLADFARRWKQGDVLLTRNGLDQYMVFDGKTWKPQPFVSIPAPFNFKGQVANQASLPATGQKPGDVYTTQNDQHMHIWSGNSWADLGAMSGAAIPPGAQKGDRLAWDMSTGKWTIERALKIRDLDDSYGALTPTDGQALVFEGVSNRWKPKHLIPYIGQKDDVVWHDGVHWTSRRLTFAMRFRGAVPTAADISKVITDPSAGDVTVTKDTSRTYVYDENGNWIDIGAAQVLLLPEGTVKGDILRWDPPTRSYFAEHHLLGSEFNVELPPVVEDETFLAFDDSTQKFEVRRIDTEKGHPLSLKDPALETHVPSSQNVVTLVGNVAKDIRGHIAAIQSGIAHQIAVMAIHNDPPAAPGPGDRYLIGDTPTGEWAGHANRVAEMLAGGWSYYTPAVGDTHYVNNLGHSVSWNGTHWIALARQTKVSLQPTAPPEPLKGDIWLDDAGVKLVVKYWDGNSWLTEAGTKTYTQETDPSLDANVSLKDGDIWIQKLPAVGGVEPTPITHVYTNGAWSTTTPSVPASSRTFMQSEVPIGPGKGDTWINLAGTKPVVSYFNGTNWIDAGGTRTFVQHTDPALDAKNAVAEGDIWSDNTVPSKPKIYQRQAGAWVQVNSGESAVIVPEAPPPLTKGTWFKRFTEGESTTYQYLTSTNSTLGIERKPDWCPVPAKYKNAGNLFRVTVFWRTYGGTIPACEVTYGVNWADGNWFRDARKLQVSSDQLVCSSSIITTGDTDALSWFVCFFTMGSGSRPEYCKIREACVTWELLNL